MLPLTYILNFFLLSLPSLLNLSIDFFLFEKHFEAFAVILARSIFKYGFHSHALALNLFCKRLDLICEFKLYLSLKTNLKPNLAPKFLQQDSICFSLNLEDLSPQMFETCLQILGFDSGSPADL